MKGLEPAPRFSKFKMGMVAMNQRFGAAAESNTEVDAEANARMAADTYFAPNPGTA